MKCFIKLTFSKLRTGDTKKEFWLNADEIQQMVEYFWEDGVNAGKFKSTKITLKHGMHNVGSFKVIEVEEEVNEIMRRMLQ